MTDDEAFIRAIVANPGDDAPRLVYADWLDDRGEATRANILRLNCATPRATDRRALEGLDPDWVERVCRPPFGMCVLADDDRQTPASPEEVDRLLQTPGLGLPKDYRTFLLRCNGGTFRRALLRRLRQARADTNSSGDLRPLQEWRAAQFYGVRATGGKVQDLGQRIEMHLGPFAPMRGLFVRPTAGLEQIFGSGFGDFRYMIPVGEIEDDGDGISLYLGVGGQYAGRVFADRANGITWDPNRVTSTAPSFSEFLALVT